jgi:hypothetical protein
MINLENICGRLLPPASDEELQLAQVQLKLQLPIDYLSILRAANGIEFENGAILYTSGQLLERNMTYEVFEYLPNMLAIGDDGGGKLLLIERKLNSMSIVYAIDAGSLGVIEPTVISPSLETWANNGFLLGSSELGETPEFADIYLTQIPAEGMKSFIGIKAELGINTTLIEMKKGAESLPFLVLQRVPFGKYQKRAERANHLFGKCLEVRASI